MTELRTGAAAAAQADTSSPILPPLSQFLAGLEWVVEARRVPLLWEDQRERWRRGERTPVEEYLRGVPEPLPSEAIIDLIYGEYVLRLEAGETPSQEEIYGRFPDQAVSVCRQLALHEGLSDIDATRSAQRQQAAPRLSTDDSPTEIAGYRVVAPLDAGGQGMVYRGVHPTLGRDVVIKVARRVTASGPDAELLVQEGRILAELDHPGLARVYDMKIIDGQPILVMEYIRGSHLEQDAQRRKRTPRESALLVARIARALEQVHRRGVVHRDIKPRNIVIDEAGNPRLIDFGLALFEDAWRSSAENVGVCGTVTYMAPEQARGEPATPRSDLYALGGVLYFLLVGHAPFVGDDIYASLRKAQESDWDRQALIEAKLPPQLRSTMEKALAANPEERHASADALADDLEQAVNSSPARRWLVPAVVGAAIVVAGLATAPLWLPTTNPVPDKDKTAKLDVSKRLNALQVRVWRAKRYVELLNGVPVTDGDEMRFETIAPAGMHATLFLISSGGKVELLASTPRAEKDRPITYPALANKSAKVSGPAGNEMILMCARVSEPVTIEELRASLTAATTWPALPSDSVLALTHAGVSVLQGGRDLGLPGDRSDPEGDVRRGLDDIREKLRDKMDYFEGVVFSHGK